MWAIPDVFIKCFNINPKQFLDNNNILVSKFLINSKYRLNYLNFFSSYDFNIDVSESEKIICNKMFHDLKYSTLLSNWNSFTVYISNPDKYWEHDSYVLESVKEMEHVLKIVLRRKKLETLLSKS